MRAWARKRNSDRWRSSAGATLCVELPVVAASLGVPCASGERSRKLFDFELPSWPSELGACRGQPRFDPAGDRAPGRVRAPRVLRELGLVERIDGDDLGDVLSPPYQDFKCPPARPRNEQGVASYSRALADYVARGMADGKFVLVLGGDCSIVLGTLLGAGRRAQQVGLAYLDAHADFATPQESLTGSVASMCLALAIGRGDSDLARLAGATPLVHARDVVLIGRRDANETGYGHEALARSDILDIPDTRFWTQDVPDIAPAALARLGRDDLNGFWIHVDADLLDPRVCPPSIHQNPADRDSMRWLCCSPHL